MKPGINTVALEKFLENNFQRSEEVQNFVLEAALEGFTLLYENTRLRALAEEQKKYKISDELLDKLSQGDREPLRQALLNDRPDDLEFRPGSRFASYTQPLFYETFVLALEGTSVKKLNVNGIQFKGDCARGLFLGLPKTNVEVLCLASTNLDEQSANVLAEIIPRTALVSIYVFDKTIRKSTSDKIAAFPIFNRSRSTLIGMLDDLKKADDEAIMRVMRDNDCFHLFQTSQEKISHFREYIDLLALDKMSNEEQQDHNVDRLGKLSLY